jgi:uncharacterized protein YkwD
MKKWIVIVVLVLILAGAGAVGYKVLNKEEPKAQTNPTPAAPPPATPSEATTAPEVQLDTAEIHGLINEERKKAGLKALTVNDDLYDSALAKCEDMKKNNYFTHTSPTGTDYTTLIKKSVPSAKLMGENLGAGYTDNPTLVKEWMASAKHKENILNSKFTAEGIAVCGKSSEKPGLIIVAHFIQS